MDQAKQHVDSSVALLSERVDAVAAEVGRAMAAPLVLPGDVVSLRRWITTGVGASEGPARLLATLLRAEGVLADFAPISAFVDGAPPAEACVVFSQGLSPNARIPLARAGDYARALLVTASQAHPRGVTVIRHGPASEDGLLLRVVGPAAASAIAIRLAAAVARKPHASALDLDGARRRASAQRVDPAALFDLAGIVTAGTDATLCDGLRHKLLEGLGVAHPPIWDICALVHGPLQSFYDREDAALLVLEREGVATELFDRLARVVRPSHRVLRVRSALGGPLALLDFDLQLDHLVVEALRARPRDLAEWPGKGRDGPLYELGKHP